MIPILSNRPSRRLGPVGLVLVLSLLAAASGCGSGTGGGGATATTESVPSGLPVVVVTFPVLGAVVEDLVGDQAHVEVLVPPGVDPHDYEPSARDVEAVAGADLVVVNGAGLEEGLTGVVEEARAAGVPVFVATEHVTLRHRGEGGGDDDHDHGGAGEVGDHGHGPEDPHIWVDPVSMAQVVAALAPVLATEVGVDVAPRAAQLEASLGALDAEVRERLSSLPEDRRFLVTAHESLGYFADRYGLLLLGALVPSLTSQADASASALAHLAEEVEHHGVASIFLEVGTPPSLAEVVAEQTGAQVVELDTHTLPDGGSYADFIRELAAAIRQGLAPG